ncbi:MAG TPA: hypothetical protein DCG34_08835 [Clostridiales bacterium]|nr:hypothetical protein [Clostridiales bacterium]
MLTLKRSFYLLWVVLAVIVRENWVPSLVEFLQIPILNFGAGYTITIWHLYTYFVLVYTSWVISRGMQYSAEIMSRSNITTLVVGIVVMLGLITTLDILYAYIFGSGELFLVQMMYELVANPSASLNTTMSMLDMANITDASVEITTNVTV